MTPHQPTTEIGTAAADRPMRATRMTPPAGALAKFAFYSRRYGPVAAVARFLGRKSDRLWGLIGTASTHGHLRRWLDRPGRRILNLGGGGNCMEECLTVDIDPRADAYVDLTRPLPFPDSSLDAVFCEEVIEHIDQPAGARLLAECARILRPGGPLRLATPDLSYFARRVLAAPDDPEEMNGIFYNHGHRHIYTPESLVRACREAGFQGMRHSRYQDPDSQLGWLDSHAERFGHPPEISQYLEAVRPG